MTAKQQIDHADGLFWIGFSMLEDALEHPVDASWNKSDILRIKRALSAIQYARQLLEDNL